MSDKPIVMSAPMVRALLAGRKSQTRRIVKPQPTQRASQIKPEKWEWYAARGRGAFSGVPASGLTDALSKCGGLPYAPGDRLWVREAFRFDRGRDAQSPASVPVDTPIIREADDWKNPALFPGRLRSPIHMPRALSRLTLTVTSVRIERLNAISEDDTIAEGASGLHDFDCQWGPEPLPTGVKCRCGDKSYRDTYRRLWDTLHGPGSWALNPFVCAIGFTVEARNIDAGGSP